MEVLPEELPPGRTSYTWKNRQFVGPTNDVSGCGSAEVLRDETVAFASKLWASGVQAELHVWAGGFHGSDMFLPDAPLSQASNKTKVAWMKRVFEIMEC